VSRQWLARGVVEAPAATVFTAWLEIGPIAGASRQPDALTDSDGVQRYQASIGEPGSSITVEVDQHRHTLAVKGNWWYRGVYTVYEGPGGSQLDYHVHNVATHLRWAVPLMQRGLPQQMQRDLIRLLHTIGRHLNCAAYLSTEREDPGPM
jgi:hypothetical protein